MFHLILLRSMKKKSASSKYSFVLSSQQTLFNLDHVKLTNYQRFVDSINLGKQIQRHARQNEWQQLDALVDKNPFEIPFVKLEVEDAFICALQLRNLETISYFLENGFDINSVAEDAALTLCNSLQYLKNESSPFEILQLILQYGANPRYASPKDSNTAIHIGSLYGSLPFVQLLLEYGADKNAVNDDKKTPLGLAIIKKHHDVIEYLKDKGASAKWNQ